MTKEETWSAFITEWERRLSESGVVVGYSCCFGAGLLMEELCFGVGTKKLDKMVEEATLQRERMEAGAAAELKIMTEDVRNSVIRKEGDANDLRRSIQAIETAQKRTAQSMKKSIKNDNKNYEILKNSRINEVNQWKEELSHLKGIIKRIELELEADEMKMKMKMNDTNNTEEYTIFQQLEDVQRHMLSIHAARV